MVVTHFCSVPNLAVGHFTDEAEGRVPGLGVPGEEGTDGVLSSGTSNQGNVLTGSTFSIQ